MFDHVTRLATDRSCSWVIARPLEKCRPGSYFAREALTQLVFAALLAALLLLRPDARIATSLALVALAGSTAFAGTSGTQMKRWSLPSSYALGVGAKLVMGRLLATAALSLWPFRSG